MDDVHSQQCLEPEEAMAIAVKHPTARQGRIHPHPTIDC